LLQLSFLIDGKQHVAIYGVARAVRFRDFPEMLSTSMTTQMAHKWRLWLGGLFFALMFFYVGVNIYFHAFQIGSYTGWQGESRTGYTFTPRTLIRTAYRSLATRRRGNRN
jgi:hypothetical protein